MNVSERPVNPASSDKPVSVQRLIGEATTLLAALGIPVTTPTRRRLERTVMAFLAVIEVRDSEKWSDAKDIESSSGMTTRKIIAFWNNYFGENISPGSYDDIRRRDLLPLTLAGIVVPTAPESATNAPNRGYGLSREYIGVVRAFGSLDWQDKVATFMQDRKALQDQLNSRRHVKKTPVRLPQGTLVALGPGEHNVLQKAVIEELLPRFGYGAQVLYVGDADDRQLHKDEEQLQKLSFFDVSDRQLPDVVAYSQEKNWVYLIEAVHTFGALSPERMLKLRELTAKCTAGIIFVTAFRDRITFRKFLADIAWETEVWIAEEPDHLIHFDGQRFLGPYPDIETTCHE